MKHIKKYFFTLIILFSGHFIFSHGGEDHGDEQKKAITARTYFSSTATSEAYELLLKYSPIKKGEKAVMQLFVSNVNTNEPVDEAKIKITSSDDKTMLFEIKQTDIGIYLVTGIFPESRAFNLNVTINSALGPDLMVLNNIEVGKELPALVGENADKPSIIDNNLFLFLAGFMLALIIVFTLNKLKSRRINATLLLLVFIFGAVPVSFNINAHGGEDHGDNNYNANGNLSNSFIVPKETQFLFGVLTKKIGIGDFTEATKLFGTIVPSSNGQAIVTSPQNGKIISMNVSVGQNVKQGQVLAVIEQNIDAAAQVTLLAEKNNIDAEYEAAKKEYERLKTIQDIASKKELAESEARFQKVSENKKLFNSMGGKTIVLKSPIDGVLGNFTFSIGSTINVSETVFTITNLSKVYVEAQVFDKDAEKVNIGVKYTVECTNDNHKTAEVKLLALAQNINPTNQSQRVLFDMDNANGEFKIGEFVNIFAFAKKSEMKIAVPNAAISQLNGKPIVFIKDNAEQYSLSYVSLGENNGTHTVINKGIEEDEKIVTSGSYQLKMIYLNQ